jgi:hypothetical protein
MYMSSGVPETDIYTAEDCEDAIADERFASPDLFLTDDQNMVG